MGNSASISLFCVLDVLLLRSKTRSSRRIDWIGIGKAYGISRQHKWHILQTKMARILQEKDTKMDLKRSVSDPVLNKK